MLRECVYDCRHPLWGGEGVCVDSDDASATAECSCDPGFVSRNTIGYPSCVPKRTLVAVYSSIAAAAAAVTLFLLWNAVQYRHLPSRLRGTRKASLRLRVLLSGSCFTAGVGITFLILAALGGSVCLWDQGVVQAFYAVCLQIFAFAASMLTEFWMDSLPCQFLSTTSLAAKLKRAAEKEHTVSLTLWLAVNGLLLAVGYTFFPLWTVFINDMMTVVLATIMTGVIISIGVQIAGFIHQASATARSATAKAFYDTAERNLLMQTRASFLLTAVLDLSLVLLHLTSFGQGTPLILITVQVAVGTLACVPFAHATKFASSAETPSAETLARTEVSVTRTFLSGLPAGMVGGRAASTRATETQREAREDARVLTPVIALKPGRDSTDRIANPARQVIPTVVEEHPPCSWSSSSCSTVSGSV